MVKSNDQPNLVQVSKSDSIKKETALRSDRVTHRKKNIKKNLHKLIEAF